MTGMRVVGDAKALGHVAPLLLVHFALDGRPKLRPNDPHHDNGRRLATPTFVALRYFARAFVT